jgi:hypothetical protein
VNLVGSEGKSLVPNCPTTVIATEIMAAVLAVLSVSYHAASRLFSSQDSAHEPQRHEQWQDRAGPSHARQHGKEVEVLASTPKPRLAGRV